MTKEESNQLIDEALLGNGEALEALIMEVQDLLYNLSLRMLGSIADAQDATQEILVKIMTNLSSFRKEAAFTTWAYRIAVNALIDYKKSMFAAHPLDFEFYANDIKAGFIEDACYYDKEEKEQLATELKLSCTNVMLQCLQPMNRCIFILGTMFHLDSKTAGEILQITSDSYRQRLSRSRRKMASFLRAYCETSNGLCSCSKRVSYAIATHRLTPGLLEYSQLQQLPADQIHRVYTAMEAIDDQMSIFDTLPSYRTSAHVQQFIKRLIASDEMHIVKSRG